MDLGSVYSDRVKQFQQALTRINKKINTISNARLTVAIAFIAMIYFGFQQHSLLLTLPCLLVGFILLMREHGKLYETKTHLENLVKLNELEVRSIHGDRSGFATGSEFIDPHHAYSHDLDIFGDGSLFQYINRCNTLTGKKKFAKALSGSLSSSNEILQRQEASRDLTEKIEFRQHFQAAGMSLEERAQDREELLAWVNQPNFVFGKKIYQVLLIIIPTITIALVIGWIFDPIFRPFALLLAGFQWAFLGFHMKRVNAFHNYIGKKRNILSKYATLLSYIEQETFQSEKLNALKKKAMDASAQVKGLASLVHAFDARMNAMTTLFTNSLLLYDLQCVYRLERWKEKNAVNLEDWLDVIAETELISSIATFSYNHPTYCYPTITDQQYIKALSLGHPLIPVNETITNDLYIGPGQQALIITGANMAGKSTFLRTVGVNLVLALNGVPVHAKQFECPIIQLRTGMRTADSLKDHQSYFYAELDRLKRIMGDLRKNIPLLILLDEILKGTNSADKQAGSIALVKQLLPHPCLAMVATHDLALGSLETEYPNAVKNFCFEANIENDQLSFDYKLKPGLAQKMNATFLMKKMGIIPS